jgi:pentatricopeptide repeat protein
VYNVVLGNILRAKQWQLAYGLFDEMRQRALSPDRYKNSTLITHFVKECLFDDALSWLQKMEMIDGKVGSTKILPLSSRPPQPPSFIPSVNQRNHPMWLKLTAISGMIRS